MCSLGNISMAAVATNRVLFERGNIRVTDSRFETGTETYPLRKISRVRVEAERRNLRMGIGLASAGLLALLGGMLTSFPVLIVSGAAFTVGGAILCFKRISRSVVLTTRGRDVKTVTSKDGALIESIAAALRDALQNRA